MKRARLEKSGVKSTAADHIDVIAEEFVRGNEHRLSQFGHFMHICRCLKHFKCTNRSFEFIA